MTKCNKCSQEKEDSEFFKSNRTRCKQCIQEANRKRLERPEARAAYLAYQKDYRAPGTVGALKRDLRRREAQAIVLEAKNRPCQDCGVKFHPACMEFDHRNPSEKFRDVSALASCTYRLSRLKAEIEKCDLVCANCHRLRSVARGVYPKWYPTT